MKQNDTADEGAPPHEGALAGVRVLDLTDERAIYGAKLLADLGADVVRPEPPAGDPLRERGPHWDGGGEDHTSLWHAFFASSRRFVSLDLETQDGIDTLDQLAGAADIVLACDGAFGAREANLETRLMDREDLIVVDTTSFGRSGPWADYLAPDLVAGALGGAMATTGDADTPPLKSFGELNFMVSGIYVAIAALAALFSRRARGEGQRVDVSAHECIVSCLEHVLMFYWYHETLARPDRVLPRRGAQHWTDAYDVLKAKSGSIMVTPAPDWENQLMWLIEEGVHEDLIDPKYLEPENLRLRVERTMDILARWVATKDAETLFFEAQRRHAPYGWVLPIENVADNPQLEARDWFVPYRAGAGELKSPGAPYHFSATPWRLGDYEPIAADSDTVKDALGWQR
jgi:benzylsuccinate CoA-transferase BbsE subunit